MKKIKTLLVWNGMEVMLQPFNKPSFYPEFCALCRLKNKHSKKCIAYRKRESKKLEKLRKLTELKEKRRKAKKITMTVGELEEKISEAEDNVYRDY